MNNYLIYKFIGAIDWYLVTLERPVNDQEKKLYNYMSELKWNLDEKKYPSLKGYPRSINRRNTEAILKDMILVSVKINDITNFIDIDPSKFYL